MLAISSEWVGIAALTREGRSLSNLESRERQGRGMGGLSGIVGRCAERSTSTGAWSTLLGQFQRMAALSVWVSRPRDGSSHTASRRLAES